ncbi:tetratricopeptide repeat protein [Streptomyces niveus]|uniref:tetratricopeptide repeat protein n=1 Tax=Streptomyces niveus TaxID=193462 RepID=UPI0037AC1B27
MRDRRRPTRPRGRPPGHPAGPEQPGPRHRSVEATESVLADCVRFLGPGHPRTLTTRRDLARAHRAAGVLPEAIVVCERAVRDSTRKMGDDHRITRTMRSELASLRGKLVTMTTPYGPGASHRVGRTAD